MSFLAPIFNALFGGGPQAPQQQAPVINIPPPTPAPPAPDRSDAEISAAAAGQRRRYGIAGGTSNMLTGGMGVASSSTYSAVTALLGGGR